MLYSDIKMVIKINDLRREIAEEERSKARELEIKIDKEIKSNKKNLFNGKYISINVGENDFETIRICNYLTQIYQEENQEFNIKSYVEDGEMTLNFRIKPEYLI